jgi:hypothetical protein
MGVLLSMINHKKNIEEMWSEVEAYYSRVYKVKFKTRLKDHQILHLFKQMNKLNDEIRYHFEMKRLRKLNQE